MIKKGKKNILHIIFFVVWLGITIVWFRAFGENLFLVFPSFFLFSAYVVFFIAVPVFYYGKIIAGWKWRKLVIGFVIMLFIIPIATHVHIWFLDKAEVNALHEFIASVASDDIPEKFIGYDPEDVNCLANYITPEYTIKSEYFFGMTEWWVTFENGKEFYLTTQQMDFSHWHVNVGCYY